MMMTSIILASSKLPVGLSRCVRRPARRIDRAPAVCGAPSRHRHSGSVALAPALIGEHVGLDEVADGIWAVYFYDYLLGHLNEREGHVQGVHVRTKTSR